MRTLSPFALLLLLACASDTAGPDTGAGDTDSGPPVDTDTAVPVDADGDGFDTERDCDDTDRKVNPDAYEMCNGYDDDCDGHTDESDAVDQEIQFPDEDGDGYGDAEGQQRLACPGEPGLSENDDDCDDTSAATHPGAPEPDCDDPIDHNCDGRLPTEDLDGDGSPACEDCDDADAETYPGAANVCHDCDDTTENVSFSNDFSAGSGDFSLAGAATIDAAALQITADEVDSMGLAVFATPVPATAAFELSFSVAMCCTSGADGVAVAFVHPYEDDAPVVGGGPYFGLLGLTGHAVALDTLADTVAGEVSDNALNFYEFSAGDLALTVLGSTDIAGFTLDDGAARTYVLAYSWAADVATVEVLVDGESLGSSSWDQPDAPMVMVLAGGTSGVFHTSQTFDDVVMRQCE